MSLRFLLLIIIIIIIIIIIMRSLTPEVVAELQEQMPGFAAWWEAGKKCKGVRNKEKETKNKRRSNAKRQAKTLCVIAGSIRPEVT